MVQAPGLLERRLGAPDEMAAIGQLGQRIEVRQVLDAVFGRAPVGDVLHDAGATDVPPVLVELGLGLHVQDATCRAHHRHGHVRRQRAGLAQRAPQQRHEAVALLGRHHAQQPAQRHRCARLQAQHPQALGRHHQCAATAVPVEAAHAREVLCPGQLGLAALEFEPGPGVAQQEAQALLQQPPLRRLDEEVGGARVVGAQHRGIVVQAGEHQHGHVREARQRAYRAAGGKAVEPGHLRIQDDQVRNPVGQFLQGRLATAHPGDAKPALAQFQRGDQQVDLVVVDQQHVGHPHVARVERMRRKRCHGGFSRRE